MITNFCSVGENIRKYRKKKLLTQEKLAELCELSTNYIGMLERAEKIPSLDTLIRIVNTLEITADMLLCGVTDRGYQMKSSQCTEQIGTLPKREQRKIYEMIALMIQHAQQQ